MIISLQLESRAVLGMETVALSSPVRKQIHCAVLVLACR